MQSLWDDRKADQYEGELAGCVYAARLLGQEPSCVLPGYGSVALKSRITNLVGEMEDILSVSGRGQDLRVIEPQGFSVVRLKPLVKLIDLEAVAETELANELACSRRRTGAPLPPAETLIHAVLPGLCSVYTQPGALLAVVSTPTGKERLGEIYGDAVLIVEYACPGFPLARACACALQARSRGEVAEVVLLGYGLVTVAETPKAAYERTVELATLAERYLQVHAAWSIPSVSAPRADKAVRQELADLRKVASEVAGFPLILSVHNDPCVANFCQRDDLDDITLRGLPVPDWSVICKSLPLLGRQMEKYGQDYQRYIDLPVAGQPLDVRKPVEWGDPAPRVILDRQLGLLTLGRTAAQAASVGSAYGQAIEIMNRAEALGSYQAFPVAGAFAAEYSALQPVQGDAAMFSGEVALVTGGASGIGKACVEALLARGAAVVSMDINPVVESLYDRPDYLGLECDLTDESAVLLCFEAFVRVFGGLDMLVLNAGIFPAGIRIEALDMDTWQRVLRINLDHNIIVMREAYPLLKRAPRYGRVVLNASKNVLAPGAGAAAYSASKAAVTQLARVAILEWSKDGIRVNMIHPDAVFDTGIWTEEVLKARAAHYGLTVQQYKTRNLLGVELNSRYVGELVAEMLGPRFEKITGAQIPVDGGSDRVV